MTANDIIESALRKIGAKSIGFDLDATEAADALLELNNFIHELGNYDLVSPYRTRETFTLTAGTHTYTWGTGADLNSVMPIELVSASLTLDDLNYPLRRFSYEEWERITDKVSRSRPGRYVFEPGDTTVTLFFDRPPDEAYTLNTAALKPFTTFSALNSEDAVPDRNLNLLIYNLGVRMTPEYEIDPPAKVVEIAGDTLRAAKEKNLVSRVTPLEVDRALQFPVGYGSRYNINSDTYNS